MEGMKKDSVPGRGQARRRFRVAVAACISRIEKRKITEKEVIFFGRSLGFECHIR